MKPRPFSYGTEISKILSKPEYIFGIDVAEVNGAINPELIRSPDNHIKFVYAGCGQYVYRRVDMQLFRTWGLLRAINMPRGPYFVPRIASDSPVKDQVKFIVDILAGAGYSQGDLPLVLDLEIIPYGLTLKTCTEFINDMLVQCDKAINKKFGSWAGMTGIYTRASWLDQYAQLGKIDMGKGSNCRTRRIEFVANYSTDPHLVPSSPISPSGWGDPDIWQLNADGNMLGRRMGVSSFSVDIDLFMGDENDWRNFFGSSNTRHMRITPNPPVYQL